MIEEIHRISHTWFIGQILHFNSFEENEFKNLMVFYNQNK